MALILFGGGAADMRGSIAGNTYSRNKAGAYVRNRTKPVNPNTVSQSFNRVRFGAQSSTWTILSPTEQASWNALASGATRLNRLGQPYTPSGRQLYMESANNLALIGVTPFAMAPINADIPAGPEYTSVLTVVEDGELNLLTLFDGAALAGFELVIKATPQAPGPKTNFSNQYRNIGHTAANPNNNIQANYIAVFGNAAGPEGSPLSVLCSLIDTATGFRSPELRLDTRWTAE